jgi:hypothetical protein
MGGNPSGSRLPSVLLSPGLLAESKIQWFFIEDCRFGLVCGV